MPCRVVYMGTPQIACPSLRVLHELSECDLVAAVTQPDRPSGRGNKLEEPEVKKLASRLGLKFFQPQRLSDEGFKNELLELNIDLIVVMAYGKILPPYILKMAQFGAVNIHASLLPRHRGAAPIQWAILEGDKETGVCLMRMDAGLDTGDILSVAKTPILPEDTAIDLHDRIALMGAEILRNQLPCYLKGELPPKKQDDTLATHARKIIKEDGRVNWSLPATQIHRRLRALMPWPGIFTYLPTGDRRLIKIISAVVSPCSGRPGRVLNADNSGITVGCGEQSLLIKTLHRQGGKILPASQFLNGYTLKAGSLFG